MSGDPVADRAVRRALVLALVLNGLFFLVELAVGLWSGSLALLSDAAHMLGDVGALALALGAAKVAQLAATRARSFGFRRAEPLGAFVNALTMLAAGLWIGWEAIHRLRVGAPDMAGLPILIVGGLGLAVNLGSAWVLARADRGNLNVRGALLHMLADALGSVGAIVAALFVMSGAPAADAVVSLLIAVIVLWATWGLLRESASVLLEFAPPGVNVKDIHDAIHGVPGVRGLHDLHVWSLDGRHTLLSAHVQVALQTERDDVTRAVSAHLQERFGIRHVTLQVEAEGPCSGGGC